MHLNEAAFSIIKHINECIACFQHWCKKQAAYHNALLNTPQSPVQQGFKENAYISCLSPASSIQSYRMLQQANLEPIRGKLP